MTWAAGTLLATLRCEKCAGVDVQMLATAQNVYHGRCQRSAYNTALDYLFA